MHQVGYLLSDGFQVMALGTQSVFEFANVVAKDTVYQVTNYSLDGGQVRSSVGALVHTEQAGAHIHADTWMIPGVVDPSARVVSAAELAFVRHAASRSRRIAGLCTGAFVLGEAGLLDGKRTTTHWAYAELLGKRFPNARIDVDRIFIEDEGVWTSAGLSSAMDLALALVEKDLGTAIADQVARVLVMYHRRSGGQSQHSRLLELAPKSDRVQAALEFARANLAGDLRVETLAAAVHTSARQFTRVCLAETGLSPARIIEQLRIEAARNLIERGLVAMEVIARNTGFRDRRHLRSVFVRRLGVAPQSLRRSGPQPGLAALEAATPLSPEPTPA